MHKPRQFRSGVVLAFTLPPALMAQAAAEYALRTAGSAAAAAGDSGAYIAGCNVNSDLLGCLNHTYPRASVVVALVLGLLVLRWLAGFQRVR